MRISNPTCPEREAQPHMLVVEDDPLSAELVALICRRAGYRVSVVGNGLGALAALRAADVDLVLLDVKLPDIDGLEVLRRMREAAPLAAVPVIFLTAMAMPAEQAELRAARPAALIVKPFRRAALLDAVALSLPRPVCGRCLP